MNITFVDLETTDKNVNTTEILTAFLRTRKLSDFSIIDEIYLTFKPEKYLEESFEIHHISLDESNKFNNRIESFRELLSYMFKHKNSLFCCHANHNVFGVNGYFDAQVIEQCCFSHSVDFNSNVYWWYQKLKFQWISTHTIAKNTMKFDNYKLDTIAKYYGFKFDHHNCKSDVEVMEKIFLELDIETEQLINIGDYKNGNNGRYSKQSRAEFKI